jgi:molecular chaperone HtpG/TNF receptor-associated protein 1
VFKEVEHDVSRGLSSEEVAPFSLWLKNELQPTITHIEVSKRLKNTPAIVVSAISSGVR